MENGRLKILAHIDFGSGKSITGNCEPETANL